MENIEQYPEIAKAVRDKVLAEFAEFYPKGHLAWLKKYEYDTGFSINRQRAERELKFQDKHPEQAIRFKERLIQAAKEFFDSETEEERKKRVGKKEAEEQKERERKYRNCMDRGMATFGTPWDNEVTEVEGWKERAALSESLKAWRQQRQDIRSSAGNPPAQQNKPPMDVPTRIHSPTPTSPNYDDISPIRLSESPDDRQYISFPSPMSVPYRSPQYGDHLWSPSRSESRSPSFEPEIPTNERVSRFAAFNANYEGQVNMPSPGPGRPRSRSSSSSSVEFICFVEKKRNDQRNNLEQNNSIGRQQDCSPSRQPDRSLRRHRDHSPSRRERHGTHRSRSRSREHRHHRHSHRHHRDSDRSREREHRRHRHSHRSASRRDHRRRESDSSSHRRRHDRKDYSGRNERRHREY